MKLLKKLLEQKGFKLDSREFAVIMEIVTDDIKFNRTGFRKKTSLCEVEAIAERTIIALRRCA
jgi:hypothetical protein